MKVYSHSDTGNGELLNDLYGDTVRYNAKTDTWLKWHENLYWKPLNEIDVYGMAVKTARHRRFEIADNLSGPQAVKEVSFAIRSENVGPIDAMLRSAKSQRPIGNLDILWDNQPNLLAVANGVVNLSTGVLRPGMRSDFISTGINLPYVPTSEAPIWNRFLHDIMCGDEEKIAFLQRAIGYTLTGFTSEQVFFLLHGSGSNGKGVLQDTLEIMLSGFAKTVRFQAFEESNTTDARKDLAELPGTRMVMASESGKKSALDTAVIKHITGEETITVSRKYGHPFSYKPQFKLWLTTNYLPHVDDDSFGFWRRIVLIPFLATFSGNNKDPKMRMKLNAELPGILAWAIEGAKLWSRDGLRIPTSLLLQVHNYQKSEDFVQQFLEERTQETSDAKIYIGDLYDAFIEWLDGRGAKISKIEFARRVSEKYEKGRDAKSVFFKNLELKVIM